MTFRRIAAVMLAAAASIASPLAALAQAGPATLPAARLLRVTGEASLRVRPDVAVALAGVESTGKDLQRLTKDAAAQMRRVIAALREAGIPEKDIQTTRHEVRVERPWTQGRPGPIAGYTVSDEVRVTIRDLARLGPALDRVTAAGSNSLRSLAFEKEDPTPERAQALAAAYAAARLKAEALARAAGVALGEVAALTESVQSGPVPAFRATANSADSGTPVAAGEIEVSGSVEVAFAIR